MRQKRQAKLFLDASADAWEEFYGDEGEQVTAFEEEQDEFYQVLDPSGNPVPKPSFRFGFQPRER